MSKPELIMRSGWAFIAGAFAFITILSGSDLISIPGSVVSAILLAVGMSRLRARKWAHAKKGKMPMCQEIPWLRRPK
jgi:hypothetical protein